MGDRTLISFLWPKQNEDLMKQGIIVRPVDNYKLEGFLRISIGTEDEITRLIESLDNML